MKARFLIDTHHLGAALRDVSGIRKRILSLRKAGARVGTCMPVICELEAGLQKTRDLVINRRILREILSEARVWPVDYAVACEYGVLFHHLRDKGRVLSQVDLMLAAMARVMHASVVTTDHDFGAVDNLKTESWFQPAQGN